MPKSVLIIDPELSGLRVDKALAAHPDIKTRSRAAQLLEEGRITRNGRPVKPSQKTTHGEEYLIDLPEPKPSALVPYDFPLDIRYEDSDLLVVNKPAGLVVHPAAGHYSDTLVNALLSHCDSLAMGFGESRPGIVHRLDKDTSGLLVVAKNDHAQLELVNQFKARTIHRIYRAIVFGRPNPAKDTIKSLLRRHPTDRKRFASGPAGKPAITHYRTLKVHPSGITLLQCKLETGRTHQIRAHLSERGCPIVGDRLYGAEKRSRSVARADLKEIIKSLSRIGLHAAELGFVHPVTNRELRFEVGWPDDLVPLIGALGWN